MYDSNVIMESLLQRACAELHRNERAYWRSVQRQCDERTLKCVHEIEVYLQDRGINVEAIYKDNDDDETNAANNNIDHISNREEQSNSCEESGENNTISSNKNCTFIYKNAKSEKALSATVMKDNVNTTPLKNYNEHAEKSKQTNKYKIDDAKSSNVNLEPLIEHISFRAQSNAHSSNHSAFTLPYAGTCTDDIVESINDINNNNTNITNSKIQYNSEDAEDGKCELPLVDCDPSELLSAVEEFGPMLSSVTDTISTTERNGINSSEEQMSEQNWQNCRSHGKVNNKTGKPLPSSALLEEEQQEEEYEQSPSSQEYSEQHQYHESTSPLLQLVPLEREEDEEQQNESKITLKKNVMHESKQECANNISGINKKHSNNNLVAGVDGNKQRSLNIDSAIPITEAINDVIESPYSSELNSPHRSFSLHFTSPPTHHVERTSHHAHPNVPSIYTSSNSNAKTSKESEELTIEHSVPEDSSEVPWIGDQSHVTRTWSLHDTCQSLLKLPEVIEVSSSALITSQDAEMYTNTTSNVQCNRQAHEENNNKTPRGSAKLHDIMQSMERVLMRFDDECHKDSENAYKTSNNYHLESGKGDDINNNNVTENILPQREKLKPLKIHTENDTHNHTRSNQEVYSLPTSSSSSPHYIPSEQHEPSTESSYSSMYKEKLHHMLLLSREKPQRYREVLKRREVMSRMQTVLQNHHLHNLESANTQNETNEHKSNKININQENALVSSGNALVMSEDTRDKVREVTSSLTKLIKLTSQVRRANEKKVKESNNEKDYEMSPQTKHVANAELLDSKLNTHTGLTNTAESMQLTVPEQDQQGNMECIISGVNADVSKTTDKTLERKSIIAKPKQTSKSMVQDGKFDEATMRKDNRHINNHTSLMEMLGCNNIANNNNIINSNSKSLCERLIAHNSYEEIAKVPQNVRKNRPHELPCKADKSEEIDHTKTTLLQGENNERNCYRNRCENTQLGLEENVSDLTSSLLSPSPRRPSTSLEGE